MALRLSRRAIKARAVIGKAKSQGIARRTDLQLDFDASVKQRSGIFQICQDGWFHSSQPFQRANRRQALAFLDGPLLGRGAGRPFSSFGV